LEKKHHNCSIFVADVESWTYFVMFAF